MGGKDGRETFHSLPLKPFLKQQMFIRRGCGGGESGIGTTMVRGPGEGTLSGHGWPPSHQCPGVVETLSSSSPKDTGPIMGSVRRPNYLQGLPLPHTTTLWFQHVNFEETEPFTFELCEGIPHHEVT